MILHNGITGFLSLVEDSLEISPLRTLQDCCYMLKFLQHQSLLILSRGHFSILGGYCSSNLGSSPCPYMLDLMVVSLDFLAEGSGGGVVLPEVGSFTLFPESTSDWSGISASSEAVDTGPNS